MAQALNSCGKRLFIILALLICLPTASQEAQEPQEPVLVAGGGGTEIAVYEYGDPAGPSILLIHGLSQSHLSWSKQYKSPALQKFRIVVIDLRGHGASEKPTKPENYDNSSVWADDIDAVIKAKNLRRPVVAAWSYAGVIITDYVRKYGDSNLAGIVFVGARVQIGMPGSRSHAGPDSRLIDGMFDTRLEINIPSTVAFIRACTVSPLTPEEFQEALAYNMAVSPEVRGGMVSHKIDGSDALAKLKVPVLIVQGERDRLVSVAAADFIAETVKHAKKSYYPNAGHSTFMEDPGRFNKELAEMAAR